MNADMKICIILNHLGLSDGVARSAISIANILYEQGNKVTLIPIYSYDKKAKNELHSGIKIHTVFNMYYRGLDKIVNIIPPNILYKLIVKENYDIEVAFQYGISTKAIAYSTNNFAKHLLWMHGYDEKLKLKKYYLKVDQIYCVSKKSSDRLYNELEGRVAVDYCYNPINDMKICEQSKKPILLERDSSVLFVSVGRQSKEKGYSRLLDCVEKLKKEGYVFKLWLIGDGPEHQELIDKTQKLGLEDIVTFVGKVSNPHAYTAKADCFICSSFSEGYSTACVEAIILNIPVLTTSVNGSEEIIKEAQAGMIVGIDTNELYKGMKEILDNRTLISIWKEKLNFTKENFSYQNRKKKILDIFKI